jgi:glycosyltransferase A (GT-A) superfamily protein (DUF2064 family)
MSRPRPRTRCVLVFARTPVLEARAKRMPAARALFACARARVLAAAASSGADLILAMPSGPAPGRPEATRLLQRGSTFAERLVNALTDARALGYEQIVVVPGDVPGLENRHLRTAFARLRACPTVLGPSPDGGVYLLGVRGNFEPILAGVPWCTAHVFKRLLANAGRAAVLPVLADVDGHTHLRALRSVPKLDAELASLVAELLARAAWPAPAVSAASSDSHPSPFASRPPPLAA